MDQKRKAIALKYERNSKTAPVLSAKGIGKMAEKIVEIAREAGVPIYEDRDLVNFLMEIELNEEIPPDLYQVVAEVLAFIYKINKN